MVFLIRLLLFFPLTLELKFDLYKKILEEDDIVEILLSLLDFIKNTLNQDDIVEIPGGLLKKVFLHQVKSNRILRINY